MLAVLHLNRMLTRRRCIRLQNMTKPVKVEPKSSVLEYCRTCLSTYDLEPLFYGNESEAKRMEDLKNVTGLEINPKDSLSQKICAACVDLINRTLQFRRTSKKSEKALLAMVTGKTKKKRKPKLQKSLKIKKKVEPVENNFDYEDDFRNDQSFPDEDDDEDTKPLKLIKKLQTGTRKRMVIPNASSYKCAQCSKEFRMKATYKAHLRFHTSYCVCEACGKRCRNNNQLQEHKRARHGLGKIHTCTYCEYSSATKEALTIHERRHTGERPYVCDHCGATFHRRSNLVQHIAIHLPEKNFQCTICMKWQKSRKLLQVHVYKVHKPKRYRYTCPDCPKIYKKPEHVRKHLTRVHHVPREMQGVIDKFIFEPSPLGEPF